MYEGSPQDSRVVPDATVSQRREFQEPEAESQVAPCRTLTGNGAGGALIPAGEYFTLAPCTPPFLHSCDSLAQPPFSI